MIVGKRLWTSAGLMELQDGMLRVVCSSKEAKICVEFMVGITGISTLAGMDLPFTFDMWLLIACAIDVIVLVLDT